MVAQEKGGILVLVLILVLVPDKNDVEQCTSSGMEGGLGTYKHPVLNFIKVGCKLLRMRKLK